MESNSIKCRKRKKSEIFFFELDAVRDVIQRQKSQTIGKIQEKNVRHMIFLVPV